MFRPVLLSAALALAFAATPASAALVWSATPVAAGGAFYIVPAQGVSVVQLPTTTAGVTQAAVAGAVSDSSSINNFRAGVVHDGATGFIDMDASLRPVPSGGGGFVNSTSINSNQVGAALLLDYVAQNTGPGPMDLYADFSFAEMSLSRSGRSGPDPALKFEIVGGAEVFTSVALADGPTLAGLDLGLSCGTSVTFGTRSNSCYRAGAAVSGYLGRLESGATFSRRYVFTLRSDQAEAATYGPGGGVAGLISDARLALRGVDVVSPPGAVPEPASWALMIAGFGLAGAALRRRRTGTA